MELFDEKHSLFPSMQIIMQEFLSVDNVVLNPVQQYLGHMSTMEVWLWWDVHSEALIKFRKNPQAGFKPKIQGSEVGNTRLLRTWQERTNTLASWNL